ncbi:MAG TPA: DUF4260 domain-containing protein [Promineifilum sp.]
MTGASASYPGMSLPRLLLHAEGAAVFFASILVYARLDAPWWAFVVFLLAPDLSAAGYLFGTRAGSITYNLTHTTIIPLSLGLAGWWLHWGWTAPVALIWLAHIGGDRMVGYGLKYPDSFKHTHFNEV